MPMPAVSSAYTSIAHWPIDWIVLGLFAALVAIDSLRTGTRRAAVFSLAAPLALYLHQAIAGTAYIGGAVGTLHFPGAQPTIFAVIFVILLFILYSVVPAPLSSGSYPLQASLAALSAAIVLVVVWLQVLALTGLWAPAHS